MEGLKTSLGNWKNDELRVQEIREIVLHQQQQQQQQQH